jgi:transcription initiation factor TFIIIB Brf1 subunit/transcription initiation factor TFIIB
MAFHSEKKEFVEISQCRECGGSEFLMDWKKKEKICKKCGLVVGKIYKPR